MLGLNRPSNWQIRNVELVWSGANVIWTLIIEETVAISKHFYSDEHDGCRKFLPNNWGYFDKEEGKFHNVVHP